MKRLRLFLALSVSFLIACGQSKQEDKMNEPEVKEHLMNANKMLVHEESKNIEEFITRHQWKMESTGTGLRIQLYEKGNGKQPALKNIVSIAYKAYLLDGTLCYSADESKPFRFIIGQGQQINGLEEGLQKMHEGDKARMVIPYHLAYGLLGDNDKIPAGSTLYYDVSLLKVEENN